MKIYSYEEQGFEILFSFPGCEAAVLNYLDQARPENLGSLEMHEYADEVFVPVRGDMWLVVYDGKDYTLEKLDNRKVYRVEKGEYHDLIMEKGSHCFIVREQVEEEKDEVEHMRLKERQIVEIRKNLKEVGDGDG